jgi:hypothetical protein
VYYNGKICITVSGMSGECTFDKTTQKSLARRLPAANFNSLCTFKLFDLDESSFRRGAFICDKNVKTLIFIYEHEFHIQYFLIKLIFIFDTFHARNVSHL